MHLPAQVRFGQGVVGKMATLLSQQLKNISLALGKPSGDSRELYASVLYGAGEAAETDTQTVYSNALHGMPDRLALADHPYIPAAWTAVLGAVEVPSDLRRH